MRATRVAMKQLAVLVNVTVTSGSRAMAFHAHERDHEIATNFTKLIKQLTCHILYILKEALDVKYIAICQKVDGQ